MDRKNQRNTKSMKHDTQLKNETGFTFIELLIAMLILVIGLIAVAGLLVAAIQGNASAKWVTVATTFAEQEAERLRSLGYSGLSITDWTTLESVSASGAGTFSRQYRITQAFADVKSIEVKVAWVGIFGGNKGVDLATYVAK